MFEKFLRHLTECNANMLTATRLNIGSFFGASLSESSIETRARYTLLLERTFDHLVGLRLRTTNPVWEWARERGPSAYDEQIRDAEEGDPEFVTTAQTARLQDWLLKCGLKLLDRGEWRLARDYCLASLSLGTGLRCSELLRLKFAHVKHLPNGAAPERLAFDIKRGDTAQTAKPHVSRAMQECVELMDRWWGDRRKGFASIAPDTDVKRLLIPGDFVFPANASGAQLTPSTLYRSLKRVAAAALVEGSLDESTRWVLETGAQGLRKAYVLASLEAQIEPSVLQLRLGHHHLRSVKRVLQRATKNG